MARIEKEVKLIRATSYDRPAFRGYGTETVSVYVMESADGTRYVWKTTGILEHERVAEEQGEARPHVNEALDEHVFGTNERGEWIVTTLLYEGDVFVIRATVKGESEYHGRPQTDVNRVKVVEVVSKKNAERIAEIAQIIEAGGEIMTMAYSRYKKHYSDCPTVPNSYDDHEDENERSYRRQLVPTIDVVVPAGRMKASGSRGKRYSEIIVVNEDGERRRVKAISDETAVRQAHKAFGGDWHVEA